MERSLRAVCIPGSFAVGAIAALALAGAGCSSSSSSDGGQPLLVRKASGATMDVTGTSWSKCFPDEPSTGMSRHTTFAFGSGTFTLTNAVYTSSVACTGATDAGQGMTETAPAAAQGDRSVGWEGTPPAGVGTTVTATAVLVSGSGTGLPATLKTLFFVNDLVSPEELHMGGKTTFAQDGYPTTLETTGRPRNP